MKFLIKNKSLFSVAKCFLASTKKSKLLLCSVALIISVLAFSVDDKEAIVLYMNKLQSLSDHKIRNDQKMSVQNFYLNNENKDPQKYERTKIRKKYVNILVKKSHFVHGFSSRKVMIFISKAPVIFLLFSKNYIEKNETKCA